MNKQDQEQTILEVISSLRSLNESLDDGRYPNEMNHIIRKNEEAIEKLERVYESFED